RSETGCQSALLRSWRSYAGPCASCHPGAAVRNCALIEYRCRPGAKGWTPAAERIWLNCHEIVTISAPSLEFGGKLDRLGVDARKIVAPMGWLDATLAEESGGSGMRSPGGIGVITISLAVMSKVS